MNRVELHCHLDGSVRPATWPIWPRVKAFRWPGRSASWWWRRATAAP
jgi:hypothetical protein